ncbi:Uncharacterized protein APZ42_006667 [Daphnia magna]|uniref:Uncharacterized protein n=1 Tax=Daphnia magna TaxID=35525 RepID=A0A164FRR4_9CRUS|nr:Uncharacterized protein APZ42_006667 [Daphnia magna]
MPGCKIIDNIRENAQHVHFIGRVRTRCVFSTCNTGQNVNHF